jgi:energy-coupling factor transport system substrate-specific component
MLGALMFSSKIAMELLPNIHLLGMFIIASTVVFRAKALLPIYIYVFLDGLIHGFNLWWLPYLYIWALLWGATMLLPKKMPKGVAIAVYPILCALHGFLFGILYAPAQMLFFSLTVKETIAWIAAGLPFDLVHGVSNFCAGLLIYPLVMLMRRLLKTPV